MGKIKKILKSAVTFGLAALTVVGTAGTAVSPVKNTTVNAANTYECTNTASSEDLGGYRVSGHGGNAYRNDALTHMYLGADNSAYCTEPFNIDNGAVGRTYEETNETVSDALAGYAYIGSNVFSGIRYYRAAQFLVWDELGYTATGGVDVTAEKNAIIQKYAEMKGQGYNFTAKIYHTVGYTDANHGQNLVSSATAKIPYVDVDVTANVHKTSANTSITNNNPNYSLEGAQFRIDVAGPATWSETVTTNANGDASFSHKFTNMPAGTAADQFTITVTETAASKGYQVNGTPVTIKSGETANIAETPVHDPANLQIEKVSDDGTTNPKSLAGAEFTFKYYAVDPDTINSVADLSGRNYETWTGSTEKMAGIYLLRFSQIAGNNHKDRNGNNTIPVGVVTIEETKAPKGYTLNNKVVTVSGANVTADANGVVLLKIVPDSSTTTGARINFGNEYTVRETPVRQGFSLVKYDSERNTNKLQGDATSLRAKFVVINNNDYNVTSIDGNGAKREAGPGQTVYEFYTNDDGTFTSNNTLLSSGNYIIREVEPPVGYTLNGTTEVALTISDDASQNGLMNSLTGSIKDKPIRGGFSFQKHDAETNATTPQGNGTLGSANYKVVTNSAKPVLVNGNWYNNGDTVFTFTTDENGAYTSASDLLPYGTYTITETSAPNGYNLDSTAAAGVQIQIRNNNQIVDLNASNTPMRGNFTFAKRDNVDKATTPEGNASLLGATYDVINKSTHSVLVDKNGDGVRDTAAEMFNPGDVVYEFTTSSENTENGVFTAPARLLPFGSYTLVEVKNPEGYQLTTDNGATTTVNFDITADGQTVDLTGTDKINNTVMRGTFSVEKKDLDLGTNRAQGDNNLSGKYALINESKHAVYIDVNGDGTINLKNEKFKPGEVIRDRSKDDASKNTQYTFQTDKNGDFSWIVPENGKVSYLQGLPYGSYDVKEVEAPKNYTTKGTILISFDITEDGQKIDRTRNLEIDPETKNAGKADKEIIANQPAYGKVEIYKHINKQAGSEFDNVCENGAQFLVILTSKLNSLYGGSMQTAWNTLKDQNGKNIVDENGNVILSSHEFSIITTGTEKDEDGDIMEGYGLSGKLATGNYTIMQFTSGTAEGYDPADIKMADEAEIVDVTANQTETVDGYLEWNDYKAIKNKRSVSNDEKVYELRILKKDAATGKLVTLNGASFQVYLDVNGNGKLDDEDKAYSSVKKNGDIDMKYYSNIGGTTKIVNGRVTMSYGGADYDTFRTFTDNDGVIEKGTFVADMVNGRTNMKGSAVQPLKLLRGHYLIVETDNSDSVNATPAGYTKQNEPLVFTVDGTHYQEIESSTDENVNENILTKVFSWFDHATRWMSGTKRLEKDDEYFVTQTVYNDRVWGELNVEKAIEPQPEGVDYSYIDRKNDIKKIEFTLYAAEDIIDPADGSVITKKGDIAKIYNADTKTYSDVGVYHPDENGKFTAKNIPLGKYTLKETSVPAGLVLQSDKQWDVEFIQKADDRTTATITKKLSIENYTHKTKFSKTDVTGEKELAGATLSILNKDGTPVMKNDGTALEWVSTDKPYYVEGLPAGEYLLHENIAIEGYVLRTSDVPFTVEDNGDVKTVRIENKTYSLSKVDACGKDVIGAEITVTDKADGEIADQWISDGSEHIIKNLVEGHTYTVSETKTPENYATFVPFEITVTSDYSKNQKVDAVDKQVIVSKSDLSGNEVEGTKLTITDKETGKVIDEWTSGNTEHYVQNTEAGKTYVLHEDTAPAGFVKVSDVEFTVADDGLDQKVTLVDTIDRIAKEDGKGNLVNGAKMQAIDKDGNIIDEWTTGQHVIDMTDDVKKSLEDGKLEHTFTDEQGREVTIYSIPKKTDDSKEEAKIESGSKAIQKEEGCKLETAKAEEKSESKYTDAQDFGWVDHFEAKVVDKEGNVSYYDIDIDGNETTHRLNGAISNSEYTIKEIAAADGYYFAENEKTKTSDKDNVSTKVVDNQIAYQIVKVDDADKVLTGVKLQLNDVTGLTRKSKNELTGIIPEEEVNKYNAKGTSEEASYVWVDKDNKLVDPESIELPNGGVTNGEPFDITGKLKADHDYELRELDHVAGVFRTNSFVFHVDKIGDGQMVTIKMHDANTYIKVRKVDTKGNAIEGAHLAVYKAEKNADGEYVVAKRADGQDDMVVDWTTTSDPIDLSKYLKGSNEYGSQGYILRELEAPKGYKKADDRYFTVTGDKDVYQTIVMLDRKLPEEAKSGTQTDSRAIAGTVLWTAAGIAVVALVIASIKRNKKEDSDHEGSDKSE